MPKHHGSWVWRCDDPRGEDSPFCSYLSDAHPTPEKAAIAYHLRHLEPRPDLPYMVWVREVNRMENPVRIFLHDSGNGLGKVAARVARATDEEIIRKRLEWEKKEREADKLRFLLEQELITVEEFNERFAVIYS